jgi:hypothetical protein
VNRLTCDEVRRDPSRHHPPICRHMCLRWAVERSCSRRSPLKDSSLSCFVGSYNRMLWMTGSGEKGGVPFQT